MTNRQRFPLLIDGRRVMLDAGVESGRTPAAPWPYVELDHHSLIAPMPIPPEGMRVPVNLPGGRVITVVFGPAKAHYVSLEL